MARPTPGNGSADVAVLGDVHDDYERVLSAPALEFLATLHREFQPRRKELLARREKRQRAIDGGDSLQLLPETRDVRSGNWTVAGVPEALQRRTVEITGPVSRKMIINALNSGADVFMADFEDANSPTWANCIEGQLNLQAAIRREIDFEDQKKGKWYRLNEQTATLMVRPRGWHLEEKHLTIGSERMSASLMDFGLYFFHNARELLDRGAGPYFYLPKLESHLEARLWNDVFNFAQDELGIGRGTIKATVLIETIHAAFEMDEILYELREHSAGLNAGRWDYIFSAIKTFRNRNDVLFPDRGDVTMKVPFMDAYARRLVKTCHQRKAYAIGGMAAFIPTRHDEEANRRAFQKVKADKERESSLGFDGTWVAHPGLVEEAREAFDSVLNGSPHQIERTLDYEVPSPAALTDFEISEGKITEEGLRTNINVGIQYIASWLRGVGAAAIFNLMEDAATAEISRSQVWQWLKHDQARLEDGREIDQALYRAIVEEEMASIEEMVGKEFFAKGRFNEAREVFDRVACSAEFPNFLTLIAYEGLRG